MNLDEIRELIRLMKDNQIAEIDVETAGEHVRIKSEPPPAAIPSPIPVPVYAPPAHVTPHVPPMPLHPHLPNAAHPHAEPGPAVKPAEPDSGVVITSPIVGVFYSAPSPDKPAFVEIGSKIDESTVLCIIEAMKVMNEIKAETTGTVREVLVENGQSVEYGQPMFVIDPL